jgi:dephospho-CoA kinase
MVIGVTGKYAAGKDEVSRVLVERGFLEINVDALGHRVLEEKKEAAIRLFGNSCLRADGTVDRATLGRIVFRRPLELRKLEALLHPRMRELVIEEIRKAGNRHCVINAAILFHMGLADLTRLVIHVRAPFCTRFQRTRKRNGLSLPAFLARCRVQRKIVPKPVPGKVDIVTIWNTRNKTYLKDRIDEMLLRRVPEGTREKIR